MNYKKKIMRGVFPILSTPFDQNGDIIFDDLISEVEWGIESGVSGLAVALASEVYKFTESERDKVLDTVVKAAKGRIKVVMNTGGESNKICIEYSKKAEYLGADALMIAPPIFGGIHQNEIKKYFLDVAENVSIPIFMQDIGESPVPPDFAVELSNSNANLKYIKVEVPPTIPRFNRLKELSKNENAPIPFGGAGGLFMIEELRRGSQGTMPVCAVPEMFVKVFDLWNEGKEIEAEDIFHKYIPLIRTLGQGLGIWNWLPKIILKRRGIFSQAFARRPSLQPDRNQIEELNRQLDKLDL